jgi:hypothetical protein
MCGKFTEKPDCTTLTMKQLGKPREWKPWNVDAPSAHFSVSVTPSPPVHLVAGAAGVVGADLEARRVDEAVDRVLDPVGPHAAVSVMRSTPRPSVSTRW